MRNQGFSVSRRGMRFLQGPSADRACLSRNHVGSTSLSDYARSKGGEPKSRQEGATAEKAVPFSKPRLSMVIPLRSTKAAPPTAHYRPRDNDDAGLLDFSGQAQQAHSYSSVFIVPNAGHARVGKALCRREDRWHGPYPNYDEALGKAKEMTRAASSNPITGIAGCCARA